jgi:hypothetical protein
MTTTDVPTIDVAENEAFVGQAMVDMGAATSGPCIGDRLDQYKAMTCAGPVTSVTLTRRTGTTERYGRNGSATRQPDSLVRQPNQIPGRYAVNSESSVTETVVRNHLQAFLEQKGIAAILNDYDENARFYSEAKIYQGKQEIHGFFTDFIGSLPAGGIEDFSLRSQRVDGNIAYITWSVGSDIPLGTDTFIVNNDKIVSQTFAMYAVPAQ